MCIVLLPPGDNPIAVNKYLNISILNVTRRYDIDVVFNTRVCVKTAGDLTSNLYREIN